MPGAEKNSAIDAVVTEFSLTHQPPGSRPRKRQIGECQQIVLIKFVAHDFNDSIFDCDSAINLEFCLPDSSLIFQFPLPPEISFNFKSPRRIQDSHIFFGP